jgi:protein TonB
MAQGGRLIRRGIRAFALVALAGAGAATLAAAVPAAAPAATAAPAPIEEVVVDAAVRNDDMPGAIKSYSVRWPYTATVRFTITRVGGVRDLAFEPADAPTEVREALTGAAARWRFWPALGACRYVEQEARATIVFEESRVFSEGFAFLPVAAKRTQSAAGFAWLDPADAGDRRPRPRLGPAGIVEPVGLKQVLPRYPANASRQAQPGYAFVLVEVGADGKPRKVTTSDAWSPDPKLAPLFGKEAAEAVKKWQFRPATVGGVPQARLACQRFMFNMKLGG